tara:strand:- start:731 stop:1015 length:285 start_codon:yes stop_codon:yes gene_type:complete
MLQHYSDVNKAKEETAPSLPPYMIEILNRISFDLATLMNNDPTDALVWKNIAAYAELAAKLVTEQKELSQQKEQEAAELEAEPLEAGAIYQEED